MCPHTVMYVSSGAATGGFGAVTGGAFGGGAFLAPAAGGGFGAPAAGMRP
jgi:hypothetical protein